MKFNKTLLIGLLIAIVIFYLSFKTTKKVMNKLSRGMRNNNPFNIRKSSINWQGKIINSSDKDFEQFETLEYGIRAGLINLRSYLNKGFDTVKKIIARYSPVDDPGNAPGSTNNYINFVARKLNVDINETIDKSQLIDLAYAILLFEAGKQEITLDEIKAVNTKFKIV